ncbi:efflux transporter outer membrane subunit [Melaminivora jejuensis]|uniref:efflux transporter outer membrane subunit n=1 Tax=Melaminivora jejuensis TaxID=1267217 RepID=UPI001E3FD31A|nr:efflux transporter outer membrane subunit [Melaminivora jejuensis]UHJ63796.1 efflux transporter outer membrane subunit [Melaminivora jejuensis]
MSSKGLRRFSCWKPLCLAAWLALAGCTAAPPHEAPLVAVGQDWLGVAPEGWVGTEHYRAWQEGRWWELFGDEGLDALMPRVEIGNQNLAAAVARVAQAQALLRQAQAQLAPTLGVQLGAQRSGEPARGSATLGLNASWAPDLWGRLQAGVAQQGANVQASQANLAAARLSAQASLAQAWFALREAEAEGALLEDIIDGYRRALAITQNNYDAGMVARTDVLQAQSTLESALSTRAGLQRSRDTYEHAIALLVGEVPSSFALHTARWVRTAPEVPPALPSELLLRRPDVVAAERAVAAANAAIGAVQAAWFPALSLSAGAGGAASSLAQLVSAPTLAWSLGATLAQALFDGGARSAATGQALAAQQVAAATYRQSVLQAISQVEDQLTALLALDEQIGHAALAAEAAAGAEERTLNSYRAGISAYTAVVTAQTAALNARRSLMQLQLQRQQAVIALIQALGGGWVAPWVEGGAATSTGARR